MSVNIAVLGVVRFGHFTCLAGVIRQDGKPVCHISYNLHIARMRTLALPNSLDPSPTLVKNRPIARQLQEFGKLLRDKRNAAGLSRVQLAHKAKLSDATIKFTETVRHPPSRATLLRLIAVEELRLTWDDTPGPPSPPAPEPAPQRMETTALRLELNYYITSPPAMTRFAASEISDAFYRGREATSNKPARTWTTRAPPPIGGVSTTWLPPVCGPAPRWPMQRDVSSRLAVQPVSRSSPWGPAMGRLKYGWSSTCLKRKPPASSCAYWTSANRC